MFESAKDIYREDLFKIITLHVRVKLFYYENVGDSKVLFTEQLWKYICIWELFEPTCYSTNAPILRIINI